MINIELFKMIARGRARRPITCASEDMVEAAQNPNKRTRYPGDLDAPGTKKRCYQCPECSGSGLVSVEDREGVEYLPCDYCDGMQCFKEPKDYFEGERDESCGFNRERLKEDWPNM